MACPDSHLNTRSSVPDESKCGITGLALFPFARWTHISISHSSLMLGIHGITGSRLFRARPLLTKRWAVAHLPHFRPPSLFAYWYSRSKRIVRNGYRQAARPLCLQDIPRYANYLRSRNVTLCCWGNAAGPMLRLLSSEVVRPFLVALVWTGSAFQGSPVAQCDRTMSISPGSIVQANLMHFLNGNHPFFLLANGVSLFHVWPTQWG